MFRFLEMDVSIYEGKKTRIRWFGICLETAKKALTDHFKSLATRFMRWMNRIS